MLSDTEYNLLEKRVAQGREFLYGKWGNTDWETKSWINTWFDLSDRLFQEMKERNMFDPYFDHDGYIKSAEAKIQQALIEKKRWIHR